MRLGLLGLLSIAVGGCESAVTPVQGCRADSGLEPDCRFQNPEDIVRVPGTDWLVVSQFGAMDGSRHGSLAAYQPSTGRLEQVFPGGEFDDDRRWGDAACPPPDAASFSPHGIDLDVHPSGRAMLLVVDHGGREAVEQFELEASNEGLAVFWRGCALGPADAYFNDVVAAADGGFFVTHMMPKNGQWLAQVRGGLFGLDTGFVYRWTPGSGFSEVPGTRAPFPNGVEKSPDGRYLYLNSSLGDEVRKVEVATGAIVARRAVAMPDNSSWDDSGRLLVASLDDSLAELLACGRIEAGACGSAFEIVALDPDSLEGFAWLAHRGAPMGGATVAVELDGSLYLGSFAGDRIARWQIPKP
jgi:hypothetical protein